MPRNVDEGARDQARMLMNTPEFIKPRDEFHLAAIVQYIKTLANHLWRPPPSEPFGYFT